MAYTHYTNLRPNPGVVDTGNKSIRQLIANLISGKSSEVEIDDNKAMQEIQKAADFFVCSHGGFKEEDELAKTLEKYNLFLYSYPYNETSQDKRDVARMAFNGWVDRPKEFDLSSTFRNLKNYPKQRSTVKPEEYDLSYSTVWNVFKQVPEFQAIEDKVKKGLSLYGVGIDDLPKLGLKDFCFVINEQFRGGKKDSAKVFEDSYKAKHTKKFINENEREFRAGILGMAGVNPEYVESLISAMKEGRTDLSNEVDPKTGKPKWEGQPVIDVHHIVNIKDASNKEALGKSFASINDYSNICFIVRHPQHDAMHALENDANGKYREDIFHNRQIDKKFIYRIQPPEGVKCMFGFNHVLYDKDYLKSHDISKETTSQAIESEASRDTYNKRVITLEDTRTEKKKIRA